MAVGNFVLLSIFVTLGIFTVLAEAWSGNICSTWKTRGERYRYCTYRNWRNTCCAWGWATRYVRYKEFYCCTGWTHNGNQVCNIPICSPNCFNGGTCIRPNYCNCTDGYKEPLCREGQCESYVKPCYPGYCDMNDNCQCVDGYAGTSCLTFSNQQLAPTIEECQTRFSFFHPVKNMIVYSYYTDATNKTSTEVVWTNQPIFNRLQFSFKTSFDTKFMIPSNLVRFPAQPDYIKTFSIGIVEAKVLMTHYTYNNGSLKHTENFTCTEVSQDNPLRDELLNCTLKKDSYGSSIITGDVLTFTFTAKSGGFRELINRDSGLVTAKEYYNGQTDTKVMQFRVDRDNPTHCQENYSCNSGEQSLYVVQDITKSTIETRWSGWKDILSGINRYAWEIFKLRPDHKGDLTEFGDPDPTTNAIIPPVPIINTEINHTANTFNYIHAYTPTSPGMYSIVLEAADAANNTRYARRLVLYDPSSTVTINNDPNSKIYASTAASETGNLWQKTVNKVGKTNVTIVWANHFNNIVHENGKFLNRVLGFKSYLDDGENRINYKSISPNSGFDDNEGERTKAKIPNYHGIVRFEISEDYDETGGSTINERGLIWRNTSKFEEEDTIQRSNVNDGGTMKVYVRATDIMGNTNIDSVLIHFDSSEPNISTPTMKKNIKDGAFPFSSRITVSTEDRNSGIFELKYKFIADDTKMVKHTGSVRFPKRTEAECRNMPCYQINMGDYFPFEMSFDINHCWLMVPQEKLDSQVINLEIESVNPAMLSKTATLQLRNIRGYDGIEAYFPPINVTVKTKTDTGISITWSHAATCHERTKILVTLVLSNGEVREYPVHKDATSFDLTGLEPENTYSIMIYNMFGEVKSEASALVKATTGEYKGLKAGGIAGVVIGVLLGIILIVLIVSVICWRTNRLPKPIDRVVDRPFSVVFKSEPKSYNDYTDHSNSIKASRTPRKQIYSTNLDNMDTVYYMEGQFNQSSDNMIPRRQITLEEEIARGKFAIIYKAKYNRGGQNPDTVVAKVLHEKFTNDDKSFMNAKIYFMTEIVGSHSNILQIIGAVDDPAVGPMMILEYCENGTLKDYLRARKERVDENVMEKLFRFSFDICKGMEYLASKKIVHRKLAARNVLLTFTFEVKITGFGPMAEDTNVDSEKKEMIPIKWIAPECIVDSKVATEKSDVWSYGVTLWEIFSLGEAPYSNIRSKDIHSRLMQGERLPKPEHCDDTFHGIMKRCWHKETKKRPTFKKLKSEIEQLFVTGPNDDYYYEQGHLYDNKQDHIYDNR